MSTPAERITNFLTKYYNGIGIAPHADTVRLTYTVPSTYYATIDYSSLYIERATAASTDQQVRLYVSMTQPGESEVIWHMLTFRSSSVSAITRDDQASQIMLPPGTVIKVHTGDDSVGGTMNYRCCLHILLWR
jgi:hypothetical protein